MMFTRGAMAHYGSCTGFFHGGIGIFLGIALLITATAFVVYLVKRGKFNNLNESGSESASDALKMRLVQGEISEEEYMQKKEILSKK